jgi:hypothetical protein
MVFSPAYKQPMSPLVKWYSKQQEKQKVLTNTSSANKLNMSLTIRKTKSEAISDNESASSENTHMYSSHVSDNDHPHYTAIHSPLRNISEAYESSNSSGTDGMSGKDTDVNANHNE